VPPRVAAQRTALPIAPEERVIVEPEPAPPPLTATKIVREPGAERVIVKEKLIPQEGEPRIVLPEPPRGRRAPALPARNAAHSTPTLSPPQARRRGESPPPRRDAAAMRVTPPDSASPDEPAIRVTIGRVDVRAVVKAETPRAPREPQGPRLTLDDYLRMRDGGSR
jgi:hypothetical protein